MLFAQATRLVMVLLRHVEHAHTAVVGADVIEHLHPLEGIAQRFGQLQRLAVLV